MCRSNLVCGAPTFLLALSYPLRGWSGSISVQGEDTFVINGKEVQQVTQLTIVGLVLSVVEASAYVTYTIDDGSATVEVKLWVRYQLSSYDSSYCCCWLFLLLLLLLLSLQEWTHYCRR